MNAGQLALELPAEQAAPEHCRRVARSGCGCRHCITWRAALAQHRKDRG